jgi:hypothetical protein
VEPWSHEAVVSWSTPIDLLFVDSDHSWAGIDRDWRDRSRHVVTGGAVALHDSRSVPGRLDLNNVRYTRVAILVDPLFRQKGTVESLTVLERVAARSPR